MIPSMSGKGYASKTFSRTSRTCLQLPRQLKPGQEHSRCPARPNVTLYEADGSRELVNSQLPVSSRGVSVGVAHAIWMVRLKYWVTDGEIYEALIDLADYDPGNDLALVPGAGNGETPTLRRKTQRKSRHRLTDTKF